MPQWLIDLEAEKIYLPEIWVHFSVFSSQVGTLVHVPIDGESERPAVRISSSLTNVTATSTPR